MRLTMLAKWYKSIAIQLIIIKILGDETNDASYINLTTVTSKKK